MTLSNFLGQYDLRFVSLFDPSAREPWQRYTIWIAPAGNLTPVGLARSEISSHISKDVEGNGSNEKDAREDLVRKISGESLEFQNTSGEMLVVTVPTLTVGK